MFLIDFVESLVRKSAFFTLQDWILILMCVLLGVGTICATPRHSSPGYRAAHRSPGRRH